MSNARAILISIVVSAFTVTLLFFYISGKEKELMEMVTPIEVLVATRDIAEGTRIDDTMLEVAMIPQKYVQPGAFNDSVRILNRNVYVPILKGTQILESMFAASEAGSVAPKIPADKRAFSIFMTDVIAVGDLIQPGDMVDLLLTVETGSYQDGISVTEEMITKTVLEKIMVLAINQTSSKRQNLNYQHINQEASGSVVSTAKQAGGQFRKQIKTLTLVLSPKEVQILNLSQEIGTLSASLRSSWDSGKIENIEKLSSREFLGIEKNVIPRGRPAWVEIRGSEAMSRLGN